MLPAPKLAAACSSARFLKVAARRAADNMPVGTTTEARAEWFCVIPPNFAVDSIFRLIVRDHAFLEIVPVTGSDGAAGHRAYRIEAGITTAPGTWPGSHDSLASI